uniref:Uncharacterized protein n=1 Tax=Romanomermis culicivorax TaxID=13658 RepID=A0A915IAF0_ROMCU
MTCQQMLGIVFNMHQEDQQKLWPTLFPNGECDFRAVISEQGRGVVNCTIVGNRDKIYFIDSITLPTSVKCSFVKQLVPSASHDGNQCAFIDENRSRRPVFKLTAERNSFGWAEWAACSNLFDYVENWNLEVCQFEGSCIAKSKLKAQLNHIMPQDTICLVLHRPMIS